MENWDDHMGENKLGSGVANDFGMVLSGASLVNCPRSCPRQVTSPISAESAAAHPATRLERAGEEGWIEAVRF